MPTLIATCPGCRSEIDTGLNADLYTLAMWREDRVLVLCDRCHDYQNVPVKDLTRSARPERAGWGRPISGPHGPGHADASG
jgi:Zn ribbon nucleic-acid-binding protein